MKNRKVTNAVMPITPPELDKEIKLICGDG